MAEKIDICSEKLQLGEGYYEAMKESGLFSSFHIQLIKVGVRSGKMDEVLQEISDDYEQQADASIDAMVARLEPTLVAVLAVAVRADPSFCYASAGRNPGGGRLRLTEG